MRQIVLALGVAATLVLAGCASNKGIDESGNSNKPLVDRQGQKLNSANAKKIYDSARDYLMHGQPSQALTLYSGVTARYPFSRYAPQSQLEMIAAHYDKGDYDKAVDAADQFIKQHPSNPNVDYAYYMRGLSNYARNQPGLLLDDPDKRNVVYLKQAFNDFSLLVNNYPNSVYDKDAQLHMINIRNRVAKFDLRIAEYYLKRHAYVGAARRADDIVTHYPGATSVPRALEIMETAYLKLKEPDLAEDTHAILQASYPDYLLNRSAFYEKLANRKPAGGTTSATTASSSASESTDESSSASGNGNQSSGSAQNPPKGWSLGTHNPKELPQQIINGNSQ